MYATPVIYLTQPTNTPGYVLTPNSAERVLNCIDPPDHKVWGQGAWVDVWLHRAGGFMHFISRFKCNHVAPVVNASTRASAQLTKWLVAVRNFHSRNLPHGKIKQTLYVIPLKQPVIMANPYLSMHSPRRYPVKKVKYIYVETFQNLLYTIK